MNQYRIGLDLGSTTAKIVILNNSNEIIFSKYERHNANAAETITRFFEEIVKEFKDDNSSTSIVVSGSVGMGVSERYNIPFVQEVVAATEYIKQEFPETSVIIDIGGEDAKIVYFNKNGNSDLRMNGNCSGGTGAFIDQMAHLLGMSNQEMSQLALQAQHIHPIASRCGVFCKTDIQNLISKNVNKADICASIFHAVAVQTATTLLRGNEDFSKVIFLGGPLTFLPALKKAFINHFNLQTDNVIPCDNSNLITAFGAALLNKTDQQHYTFADLLHLLKNTPQAISNTRDQLQPIFENEEKYEAWKQKKSLFNIDKIALNEAVGGVYLGIDSGSTTTKIVVIDSREKILYSKYLPNNGNPIETARKGLQELEELCQKENINLKIVGSCSTGYGEDLIKAAFNFDYGIVETIAHYVSAKRINQNVSFILDIGGQDMKAIFVENGSIYRIEINEACSSGCGSFIETFASSLNYSVSDFAKIACSSQKPCDLGTRCTVFMNSKVKQVLREGASIADIASGLSYSVVKNCLYKVLKIKDTTELGDVIIVQGGTMHNDSIVRSLEVLTGKEIYRSNIPELMGAFGCALHAKYLGDSQPVSLNDIIHIENDKQSSTICKGCENQCYVSKYYFNDRVYYSGNKCEKIFTNKGSSFKRGLNAYENKLKTLFSRENVSGENKVKIGIPRSLNTFENYPFWHKLLNVCNYEVILSDQSTFKKYEESVQTVMSDNICFPAKLVHSHIQNLIDKKVDRILFPYVIYERKSDPQAINSYNCPIVTGYSDVIKSAMNPNITVDAPVISFRTKKETYSSCSNFLKTYGLDKKLIKKAIFQAIEEQNKFEHEFIETNTTILNKSKSNGELTILLAGRPYHSDSLIQHKVSEMIAELGANVITDDIVRSSDHDDLAKTHHVLQWSYINRILKAAHWVANQGNDIHFVQLTSFGCGPDAFLIDQIQQILKRRGKNLTLIKLDDVNNIGSIKLRIRSLIESLNILYGKQTEINRPFITTKIYTKKDRKMKLIAPSFSSFVSPLLPALFEYAGYDLEILPETDGESIDYGLKYANNEVCYPATVVIGDLIKGLKSGKYDINNTVAVLTQTGGQCRATNYVALLKQAMVDAGFSNVPVIAIGMGGKGVNIQPGFKINWLKIAPVAFYALIYSDAIAKLYYAAVVREKEEGQAINLKNSYLNKAAELIRKNKFNKLLPLFREAIDAFNKIIIHIDRPQVGIVGEIFLKFNNYANKDIEGWLIKNKIQVVPPNLLNFFTQSFVNSKVREEAKIKKASTPSQIMDILYKFIRKELNKVNQMGALFPYFTPFTDIFDESKHGEKVISLHAQFGEGWLLPAEIISYAESGVNHVVSLQPFGCIANHVVSKGIENKIKKLHPQLNLLSIDFDSGVSDVNIENRLHLFINTLKESKVENKSYVSNLI